MNQSNRKPIHYLLVGYPFAGKTTVAKELEKQLGFKRLSIDEVKFELGFEGVSDDDVPDEAWDKIFTELDKRIVENLKAGKTIVNEYAWLTKEWRNRARKLATELGIETKLLFVNTPEQIARERWQQNRKNNSRFDVPDSVFEEAIKLFEKPTKDENIIVYDQSMNLDAWIEKNFYTKSNYAEFNKNRLVAIYNTVCPLDGYEKFYLELAKKLSAKTIIDIGCGTGLLTCELAKLGYQMIGLEPSRLMLDVARKSLYGEKVKWIEGDALSLEEFNADLAIMTGHVAQFHLDDEVWHKALKSIHKALKPGGYLAFESRNPAVQPWNNKDQAKNVDWYAPDFRKTVHDPTVGDIKVWLEVVEIKNNKVTTDVHYLFTKTGEELISTNTLVFRIREVIEQSLKTAGFSVEDVYGNWDGSLANSESPEFIFVARRE